VSSENSSSLRNTGVAILTINSNSVVEAKGADGQRLSGTAFASFKIVLA
jgi:hypothetical protein